MQTYIILLHKTIQYVIILCILNIFNETADFNLKWNDEEIHNTYKSYGIGISFGVIRMHFVSEFA